MVEEKRFERRKDKNESWEGGETDETHERKEGEKAGRQVGPGQPC